MLKEQALELADRLAHRFPRETVNVTRPGRDSEDRSPEQYKVETELTTPLDKERLLALISVAEESELELNTSPLGAGSAVTVVFE